MKNKLSKIVLLFLCCLLAFPSFSQEYDSGDYIDPDAPPFKPEYFAIGARVGLDVTMLRGLNGRTMPGYTGDVLPYSTYPQIDMNASITGQLMFYNQLLIQLDLSYLTIGSSIKDNERTRRIKSYHLHSRLLLGSKIAIRKLGNFVFVYGAGPYVSKRVGSSIVGDPFTWDGHYKMRKMNLYAIDYGVSVMAGFEFESFQVTLHYDHGIRNLAYDGDKMRTSSLRLSAGILFSL